MASALYRLQQWMTTTAGVLKKKFVIFHAARNFAIFVRNLSCVQVPSSSSLCNTVWFVFPNVLLTILGMTAFVFLRFAGSGGAGVGIRGQRTLPDGATPRPGCQAWFPVPPRGKKSVTLSRRPPRKHINTDDGSASYGLVLALINSLWSIFSEFS